MASLESQELVGYVLMENDNTFSEVKNLEVKKKDILTYVRFETILQSLDTVNRNKRLYHADAMIESLSDPKITELIRNNKFKGEAGHPVGQPIQRIAVVQPGNTCHRIVRWWVAGNLIRGIVETLDDGPGCPGYKLTRAILQDENPSFSYRGLAAILKKNHISEIRNKPSTVAYDEVNLPSHPEAYGDAQKTVVNKEVGGGSTAQSFQTKFVTEGAKVETLFEDQSIAVYGSDIAEMIKANSDNVKIVCESFDLDPATISLYGKNGNVVARSGSDRILIKTEVDVARQVANMWRGMR